jgi:multicomponent Na+:H+ antiporter subunit B
VFKIKVKEKVKTGEKAREKALKIFSALVLSLMVGLMMFAAGSLPELYNPYSAPATHVSPRYIEDSYAETGSPNFVTAVLADYRGYDTLGETTVIFTAGLATALLLRSGQSGQSGWSGRSGQLGESRKTPSFKEEQTCSVKGDPDE